jgi:hypothetical protein
MRYAQIINEANYRSKFDTSKTFDTEAQFKSIVGSQFGALKGKPAKESKPQAGGAVYIIDPDKGIVGYKVPNKDSQSGFIWYAVKEPFMPATKGAKTPEKQPEPKANTKFTVNQNTYDYTGEITTSYMNVGGKKSHDYIMAFLRTKPGMDPRIGVSTIDGFETVILYSKILTAEQIIKAIQSKSVKVPSSTIPATKADTKATPSKDNSEVRSALESLLREVKNAPSSSYGSYQTDPVVDEGDRFMCGIRDWGVWEMPEGEDDDGDYDWEVLSKKSGMKMKQIVDSYTAKYPNIKFGWNTEEKNWIMLYAKAK